MTTEKIVEALTAAAGQLGIRVRKERGGFRGGLCVIDGEEIILLNHRQPPQTHLAILAESLRSKPMDDIFLAPAVRAALEGSWGNGPSVEIEPDDAG